MSIRYKFDWTRLFEDAMVQRERLEVFRDQNKRVDGVFNRGMQRIEEFTYGISQKIVARDLGKLCVKLYARFQEDAINPEIHDRPLELFKNWVGRLLAMCHIEFNCNATLMLDEILKMEPTEESAIRKWREQYAEPALFLSELYSFLDFENVVLSYVYQGTVILHVAEIRKKLSNTARKILKEIPWESAKAIAEKFGLIFLSDEIQTVIISARTGVPDRTLKISWIIIDMEVYARNEGPDKLREYFAKMKNIFHADVRDRRPYTGAIKAYSRNLGTVGKTTAMLLARELAQEQSILQYVAELEEHFAEYEQVRAPTLEQIHGFFQTAVHSFPDMPVEYLFPFFAAYASFLFKFDKNAVGELVGQGRRLGSRLGNLLCSIDAKWWFKGDRETVNRTYHN